MTLVLSFLPIVLSLRISHAAFSALPEDTWVDPRSNLTLLWEWDTLVPTSNTQEYFHYSNPDKAIMKFTPNLPITDFNPAHLNPMYDSSNLIPANDGSGRTLGFTLIGVEYSYAGNYTASFSGTSGSVVVIVTDKDMNVTVVQKNAPCEKGDECLVICAVGLKVQPSGYKDNSVEWFMNDTTGLDYSIDDQILSIKDWQSTRGYSANCTVTPDYSILPPESSMSVDLQLLPAPKTLWQCLATLIEGIVSIVFNVIVIIICILIIRGKLRHPLVKEIPTNTGGNGNVNETANQKSIIWVKLKPMVLFIIIIVVFAILFILGMLFFALCPDKEDDLAAIVVAVICIVLFLVAVVLLMVVFMKRTSSCSEKTMDSDNISITSKTVESSRGRPLPPLSSPVKPNAVSPDKNAENGDVDNKKKKKKKKKKKQRGESKDDDNDGDVY